MHIYRSYAAADFLGPLTHRSPHRSWPWGRRVAVLADSPEAAVARLEAKYTVPRRGHGRYRWDRDRLEVLTSDGWQRVGTVPRLAGGTVTLGYRIISDGREYERGEALDEEAARQTFLFLRDEEEAISPGAMLEEDRSYLDAGGYAVEDWEDITPQWRAA